MLGYNPAMIRDNSTAGPDARFGRAELERTERSLLREGQWANARVQRVQINGQDWTVKDFAPRAWWVRNSVGRFLLRRELRALALLQGLDGVSAQAFRIDAFAMATRFQPGRSLAQVQPEEVTPAFFITLETLVRAMHARGLVHLDIRGPKNLLLMPDGRPGLIDFQSSLRTRWMPGFLRRILEDIDIGGVYKRWDRWYPGTLDAERRRVFERGNRLRRFWLLRGYPTLTAKRRPNDGTGI